MTNESKPEFNRESILEENRLLSEVAESYRKELEAMRAGRPLLKAEGKPTRRNAYIILGGVALLSTLSPLPEHIRTALYGICVSLAILLMLIRRPRAPKITLEELDQQSLAEHDKRADEFRSRRMLLDATIPSGPQEPWGNRRHRKPEGPKGRAGCQEPASPTPRILVDGVLMPTVDDTEWKYEKTITDRSHVHYSYVYTMWNHEIGIANTKGVFRLFVRQANGRLSSELVDPTSATNEHCNAIWEFQKEAIRLRVHAERMKALAEAQEKTLPHQQINPDQAEGPMA